MQGMELVGDHHLHLAPASGGVQLGGCLGGGAELGAAVDDIDPGRDVLQRQRPVHGRVAAPGDHDVLAAELLALAAGVADGAGGLERLQPGQRRAVRAERPSASRQHDGLAMHLIPGVGVQGKRAGLAAQRIHPAAQQPRHPERGNLPLQVFDQVPGRDRGMRRDVVDRLLRIQRRALPADLAERIDQGGTQLQHAALEGGEQPDWACADDRHVCFNRYVHRWLGSTSLTAINPVSE